MSRRVGRHTITAVINDIVLLAARVAIGGIFVAHGLRKYNDDFVGIEKQIDGFGIPHADLVGQGVAYLEIVAGGLLVLGLLSGVAGVVLAAEMAAFVYYAHPIRVVFVDVGGWELAVALGAGALVLGLVAPGRLTLDNLVSWPMKRWSAKRKAAKAETAEETAAEDPTGDSVTLKESAKVDA